MRDVKKGTYNGKYEAKFMDWIHYIFGENPPDARTLEMMYVAYKYGFEQGLCKAVKENENA